MNADRFQTLFDYNYWARDRLISALKDIPYPEYAKPNGFTYGSIRGILVHCLDAEFGWRSRFEGNARTELLDENSLPTLAALTERWQQEEAKMRQYLATLDDDDLANDLVWRTADGIERRLPSKWMSLAHLLNHSTQHRSEAAESLTMIGRSPGDLDLGVFASR